LHCRETTALIAPGTKRRLINVLFSAKLAGCRIAAPSREKERLTRQESHCGFRISKDPAPDRNHQKLDPRTS